MNKKINIREEYDKPIYFLLKLDLSSVQTLLSERDNYCLYQLKNNVLHSFNKKSVLYSIISLKICTFTPLNIRLLIFKKHRVVFVFNNLIKRSLFVFLVLGKKYKKHNK